MEVTDDGIGFSAEEKKQAASGIGLFNMQNRVRMLEATLDFNSTQTKGTKAILTIPWA